MIKFEWDEAKRLANIRSHGIDFADLRELFESESYIRIDDRFDYDEIRLLTIGMANGRILSVSHTENDGLIRIISARKAQKHEQEIYFSRVRD